MMMTFSALLSGWRRSRRRGVCPLHDEGGAAIVEFALTLPVLLALFVLVTEGGRVMWHHQQITKGVRDATRYLTRVAAAADLCPVGGGTNPFPAAFLGGARNLSLRGSLAPSDPYLIPSWTAADSIQATIACIDNAASTYRAPRRFALITVTATVPLDFPVVRLLDVLGDSSPTTLTFTVTDQARHYGE